MLTQRDEAAGLEFSVSPETGGELAGLRVRWKDSWVELIHRAADFSNPPPGKWRGRAPWLFPAVGRNYTEEQITRMALSGADERLGSWLLDGKTLPMPIHGFVMHRVWEVVAAGAGEAACRIHSDEESRAFYPFEFELTARYGFIPNGIRAMLQVEAGASNTRAMPFSLGNHLTLALPFGSASSASDCLVRTHARQAWDLSKLNLLTDSKRPAGLAQATALCRKSALLDAVLSGFEPEECWLEVSDPASFAVRVSQRELGETAVQYTDPSRCFFVLWGDMEAGFFCPEPWYGGPNSLNERRGVVLLPPGGRFSWEMRLEILR